MLVLFLCCVLSLVSLFFQDAIAAPTKFDRRAEDELPLLRLPYGTWRASRYNAASDVYVFKNIRFAAPPVGNLRWAAPEEPTPDHSTIHDGSYGNACVQSFPSGIQPFSSGWTSWLSPITQRLYVSGDEDCLFLDVFVPGKAIRNEEKDLAVIVWISGGAYTFGAKDQAYLYDASGLIKQSGGNVIMVTGNHRLGAYGFLAGSTVEGSGLPNAALHDQHAVFKWVNQYISLLGGDPSNVSGWAMSSGAGSLLHHLVAYGGKQDPLFKRAVLLSPAFQLMWDRQGTTEDVYKQFAKLAGCEGKGLDCLRSADAATLKKANDDIQLSVPPSAYIFGPSADGKFVRQLAGLEFASGNYWKGMDSIIVSHVSNEVSGFADPSFSIASKFAGHLRFLFPPYTHDAGITRVIEEQYPPIDAPKPKYGSAMERFRAFANDCGFAYHIRSLTEAYRGKTYNIQYSTPPAVHAVDLMAVFYRFDLDFSIFGNKFSIPIPVFGNFAKTYQSYLTSHARTGDPNTYSRKEGRYAAIEWPHPNVDGGEHYSNVLDASTAGFSLVTDKQNSRTGYEFWKQLATAVTNVGGYAPPDAVMEQNLVPFSGLATNKFDTEPSVV